MEAVGSPDHGPPDHGLPGQDQELLDIFADTTALARREPDEAEEEHSRSPEDYLFAYLACLDPDRSGLPGHFGDQLRSTLSRYGVQSLRRSPELEQALLRVYRSVGRVQRSAPIITAILGRWLRECGTLTPGPSPTSVLRSAASRRNSDRGAAG